MENEKFRKLARAYREPEAAFEIIVNAIPTLKSIDGFVKTERAAQEDFRGRVTLSGLRSRLYMHSKAFGKARGRIEIYTPLSFSDFPQLRANEQYHGGNYSG